MLGGCEMVVKTTEEPQLWPLHHQQTTVNQQGTPSIIDLTTAPPFQLGLLPHLTISSNHCRAAPSDGVKVYINQATATLEHSTDSHATGRSALE